MSLNTFVAGAAIGGGLVYGALSYHVLRTSDGFEFVPKTAPIFAETFLDVRNFTANDWARHKTTVGAIMQAKKPHLLPSLAATPPAGPVQPASHNEPWPSPWNGR